MAAAIVTEPVYLQMLRVCREDIASGRLPPGARFPSERDLARAHGISRATANKVISSLVAENLLFHRPGIGSFVTPQGGLHASLIEMESFTAHARAHGLEPATDVLAFEPCAARELDAEARASLAPEAPDEPFVFVERLRRADGEPLILERRWIRARLVPGLRARDLRGSFYELLRERYHLPLEGEHHRIRARNADPATARALGIEPGAALLVVTGPGFTRGNVALWHQVLAHRADRYHLENTVRTRREPAHTAFRLTPA